MVVLGIISFAILVELGLLIWGLNKWSKAIDKSLGKFDDNITKILLMVEKSREDLFKFRSSFEGKFNQGFANQVSYIYDEMNRLKVVKDENGNVMVGKVDRDY